MIFTPARIEGACLIELQRREDERGFFARSWCAQEFKAHGLVDCIAQINYANTVRSGTVRGMHLQVEPHVEAKVVACLRGALFDVIVDLRPWSSTYLQWHGVELSADNRRMLYVPEGCAHGYQTLCDDVDMQYFASCSYAPQHATGVRFDDPAFAIEWPLPPSVVSAADRNWPAYDRERPFNLRTVA